MSKEIERMLNRRLPFKSEIIIGLLIDIIKLEERCDELETRCEELEKQCNTIAVFYGVDFKSRSDVKEEQ